MELDSIVQIRTLRDKIRDKIKSVEKSQYSSNTYGGENEYTFKGLVGGIDSLLTDISTLTKASNKFIKISNHAERNLIIQYLTKIDSGFETPENYISNFEALKIQLRSYNVRNFSERQLEFEKELEETLKIKLQLQSELIEVKKIKIKINKEHESINENIQASSDKFIEIKGQLDLIEEKRDELIEQSNELDEINNKLSEIKETATENLEEIKKSTTECKSNEKLIDSFANKVQDRDKRLGELEQSIIENNKKLLEYENQRVTILKDANILIESAKKALNYKTAEGISASFQGHYNESNNRWIYGSWIIAAFVCLGGTIALGVWVLDAAPTEIGLIIGRISLLPLPIIGAIFCANQYTKQKNIIEDYAYKMVLSKAIVGFSEQLKKNGTGDNVEYVHYIKTALEEIHRDPLRKRDKEKENKSSNIKDLVEVAERIIKMAKTEQ